jgi:hypothetical protein
MMNDDVIYALFDILIDVVVVVDLFRSSSMP